VKARLEEAELSLPLLQLPHQLRLVVDELPRLVDERREEEVREGGERHRRKGEADPDGGPAAKPSTLEGLDERLGGHCEHDRQRQLDQDRTGRPGEGEQQETPERDDDEEDDRARRDRDRDRHFPVARGPGR
jgi:hypothetical protein